MHANAHVTCNKNTLSNLLQCLISPDKVKKAAVIEKNDNEKNLDYLAFQNDSSKICKENIKDKYSQQK